MLPVVLLAMFMAGFDKAALGFNMSAQVSSLTR